MIFGLDAGKTTLQDYMLDDVFPLPSLTNGVPLHVMWCPLLLAALFRCFRGVFMMRAAPEDISSKRRERTTEAYGHRFGMGVEFTK